MAKYRWIKTNRSVLLTSMEKAIPCVPGLPDWEDYRAWVLAGGVTDAELPGTPDPDTTTLQWFGEASPAFTSTVGGRVPPPVTQSGRFLKDDGSWAAPSGGGSDPWTYLKVTSLFTISTAVFTDIPGLQFIPVANSSYEFETVLMLATASTTINPQIGFRWPTGVTSVAWINQSQSPTGQIMAFGNNISTVRTVAGGLPTTAGTWPSIGGGVIAAYGAAASSFAVQMRSESSSILVAAAVGSYLKYRVY